MNFKKADLQYDHYSWTAIKGDDPKVSGEPDNTLFSRTEGYEVLYLINKLMSKWNLKQTRSFQKIERMINEVLPGNIRSQENVSTWIHANWEKN